MNPRQAVKETIRFMLMNLMDEGKIQLEGSIDDFAEFLHDDSSFLESMEEFFVDYLTDRDMG